MKAGNAALNVVYEFGKAGAERGAPGNDHIVETGLSCAWQGVADSRPQAAPNTVPLDGIAVFLCDGEADARWCIVRAITGLQQQGTFIGAQSCCGSQKVLALDEPVHWGRRSLR